MSPLTPARDGYVSSFQSRSEISCAAVSPQIPILYLQFSRTKDRAASNAGRGFARRDEGHLPRRSGGDGRVEAAVE
jgi:hypothetical protein